MLSDLTYIQNQKQWDSGHSEQCFQKPRMGRKEDDRLRGPKPLGNACGLGFGELYNTIDIATEHIFKYIFQNCKE